MSWDVVVSESDYYVLVFMDKTLANHPRNVKAFSCEIIPLYGIQQE